MQICKVALGVTAACVLSSSCVEAFSSPRAALKLGDLRSEETRESVAAGQKTLHEENTTDAQTLGVRAVLSLHEAYNEVAALSNRNWSSQWSALAPEERILDFVDMASRASVDFVDLLEVNVTSPKWSAEYIRTQVIPFKFWFGVIGNIVITAFTCALVSMKTASSAASASKKKGITAEVMRREVPLDELAKHNIQSDVWMAIDGIVCDITDFVHVHPGGADLLQELAGKDASDQFRDVGHSEFARDLVKERAVGVLTESKRDPTKSSDAEKQSDGVFTQLKAFLKQRLPSQVFALFTHEDPYNIHKIIGLIVLVHYIVRFAFALQGSAYYNHEDSMLFDGSWFSLLSVWFCLVLQITSFQFVLPRNRVLGKPMLWQEWRAHNLIFVLRSIIGFTAYWAEERWHLKSTLDQCLLCTVRFGGILFQLYAADVSSRMLRDSKHESLTATWPLWEGCPFWVERFLKFYYAIGINQLTFMVMSGGSLKLVFAGIIILQTDSFAMTLVRKNIIKTETFHGFYFWNMVHVAFLSIFTNSGYTCMADFTMSNITNTLFNTYSSAVAVYMLRYWGLSKYGCWTGIWVGTLLHQVTDLSSLQVKLAVPVFWLIWGIGQFSVAGFIFEHRIRRFLEGGRAKPLRLKSRECLGGQIYRLRFEVPVGFACGLMPGQHVKLHTPNISKGIKTWNGRENLEVDTSEISRSYTPISPADSNSVEVLVKYYPKSESEQFREGGRASTYLIKDLKVGQDVMVSGPHGHRIYFGNGEFEVQVGKPKVKPRICAILAGGSGITPALSVIREVQAEARRKVDKTEAMRKQDYENDVATESFQVLHANRTDTDMLPLSFYEDPQQKEQLVPIHVRNLVTGPQSDKHNGLEFAPEDRASPGEKKSSLPKWSVQHGKLTKDIIAGSFDAPKDDVLVLVCGPHGFVVDFAQPLLREMGYRNIIGMW